jgi:hypothetical protein
VTEAGASDAGDGGGNATPVADAGADAGVPVAGPDAGSDAGPDAGPDAGVDGGPAAPLARPDVYQAFLDSPIRVAAPGLLRNDVSPRGEALTAAVTALPQHGALSLSPDGTFSYVPDAGFVGADSFSYSASDLVAASAPATVTLTITPPRAERTLVILVYHPENVSPRPTGAELLTRMLQVSAYFREYSYNAVTLTGVLDSNAPADIVGWFETPSTTCFDLGAYMTAADAQVSFLHYDRVVVVLAQRAGCTLSAFADLDRKFYSTPDGQAFFGVARLSVPNASPSVIAHELGHTLRNGHGSFLNCGAVPWAETGCSRFEYGDPYDFMSLGAGHPVARRKSLMGWFHPVSNRLLQVSDAGTYVFTIEPIETNTGGLKALELPRGGGFPLYLEYRQPLGSDATFGAAANVFTGLLVHAGADLVDMTPPPGSYGPSPPTDAQLTPVLPVGSSWVDPVTGNTVSVVSRAASGITVQVTIR